jgi:hypothetical protein
MAPELREENKMKTRNLIFILILTVLICPLCFGYTNVRLDGQTRTYFSYMERFVKDLDPAASPFNVNLSTQDIRAHGLRSDAMVAVYMVAIVDSNYNMTVSGESITLDGILGSGQGYWYNPMTGDTVSTFSVSSGTETLTIPDFKEDIALKVRASFDVAKVKKGQKKTFEQVRIVASPNPFNGSVDIRLSLPIANFRLPINNISIYNITGKLVNQLYQIGNRQSTIGNSYTWSPHNSPNGIYIIKAKIGNKTFTKAVTLIK